MMDGMQELIDEFVSENGELVERVTDDVLTLEQGGDQDTVDRIFRCIHSVKGNAGMLGFMQLSAFAHKVEDVFSDVRSGERSVDKPLADALLLCLDRIRDALELIAAEGEDTSDYRPELERLRELEETDSEQAPTQPAAQQAANPEESEVSEQSASPRVKALVVEDDFYSRMMLMRLMEHYGECHAAKNGLEAIEAFVDSFEGDSPQAYDVIFMDIMMPGMDGLTATRTIREIERGKGVHSSEVEARVFMTTALDDDKTINRAVYECGANKYFVKPLDVSRIRLEMETLIREK